MIPLMEMLMQGGNGAAMAQIAKQFGLNQAQAEQAVEALMPAFSQGLKRNVADPAGLAKFMAAMAGGARGGYFDNPGAAASEEGRGMGDAILGQLFGSKDVSRAVAAQASQATGLSQSILKQMLPMLAPILLGGLFKQMTGGSGGSNPLGRIFEEMMRGGGGMPQQQAPEPRAGNPWGQILEEMMKGGGQQRAPMPRQSQPSPDENPLGRIIEEMMRGGQPRQEPRGRASEQQDLPGEMPQGDNPLGRILEEMLGGGRGGRQPTDQQSNGDNPLGDIFNDMLRNGRKAEPEEQVERQPERNQWREPEEPKRQQREPRYQPDDNGEPTPQTKGGLEDLFGRMFETGRETQNDYQRGVEQIFDQFMGGGKKR